MTTNGFMDRSALLARCEQRFGEVDIPGGKVRFRAPNAGEWAMIQSHALDEDGSVDQSRIGYVNAAYIVFLTVDAEGNRIFRDGDLDAVLEMDQAVVNKIVDGIQSLETPAADLKKTSRDSAPTSSPTG